MNAAANKNLTSTVQNRAAATDLVFGIGVTGLSVARYLKRKKVSARFVDTRPAPPAIRELTDLDPHADIVLGQLPETLLRNISRVIVSPGIPETHSLLVAARGLGIEIVSDIELFVREARAPLVAVTGSNGKSTVTSLLAMMCALSGVSALAGGNLGEPALDMLEGEQPDYYLLELSSFQLQRTAHLPLKVAVLLNISPDHLDWHASEDEYRNAKYRILAEAESVVVNRADKEVSRRLAANVRVLTFGLDLPALDQFGLRTENEQQWLAKGEQALLATTEIAMVGVHNQANALAALAAGDLMGLSFPPMLQALTEFAGLPHRMQFVARVRGADYINDSKATNVGAAIASVESINGAVILIAGGQGKGGDFSALAASIGGKLKRVILLGEDAAALETAFAGLSPTTRVADMRSAVQCAAESSAPGDTVLLAPACASFDQYQNFGARGDDFQKLVLELSA